MRTHKFALSILLPFLVCLYANTVSAQITWYQDNDGDGFGNASIFQSLGIQPVGYVLNKLDCNDNSANPVTWNAVGNLGFSAGGIGYSDFASDENGTLYVVYSDDTHSDKATVMKYNGSSWITVGSAGFSADAVAEVSIAIDGNGTPYVAYRDADKGDKATVMKYNGSSWGLVGSAGFSAGVIHYTSLAIGAGGAPYVVYSDVANSSKATVMTYNGSSWVTVGSAGFSALSAASTTIAINGGGTSYIYVVYEDANVSNRATVMKYDGSSWVAVGSPGFSAGSALITSIAIDSGNTPYVAYIDWGNGGKATVMKYIGSNWVTVGSAGFSGNLNGLAKIVLDGGGAPYVCYKDAASGNKAIVMKYNGSSWVMVGSAGLSANIGSAGIALDNYGVPYAFYLDTASKASVRKMAPEILNPAVPTLSSMNDTIYCGQLTGLTANGNLNHAASWKWYTSSCGGTLAGTGNTLNIAPTATTTYYARGEGGCTTSPGSCGSATITVSNRTWYQDGDGDGFGNASASQNACAKPAGYVQNNLDCNDATANNTSWNTVGSAGFSTGAAGYTSIAIDGNNIPYVAYADANISNKITVMKYNGSSWAAVGSAGFSAGAVNNTVIAIDGNGTPYVAYKDTNNKATVMKYTGSSWGLVGNAGFSAGTIDYPSIAIDGGGTPYVAYKDANNSNRTTVMKYNGSSWVPVGSAGFSAGAASYQSIAIDGSGTPYIAYQDGGNGSKTTVMKYNGSSWVNVGSAGFSANTASYQSIAIDGSGTPYVVYQDAFFGTEATVMKYNGSSWVTVGSAAFSAGFVQYTSIAIDASGVPYVTYTDGANGLKATVMKYNGSSWVNAGNAGFSANIAFFTAIALDNQGIPYVCYQDIGNGSKATVMKMGRQSLGNPGTPTLSSLDNTIYCGEPAGLTANGNLNDAANWKWYTSSCGGTLVGTGNTLNVSPTTTTTYYARGEGSCISSPGSCGSATITVTNRPWYQDSDGDGFGNPSILQHACTKPAGYAQNNLDCNDSATHNSAWNTVGSTAGFSAGFMEYASIATDSGGTPYMLYRDGGNGGEATVKKYNGSSWVTVGAAAFSAGYIYDPSIAIDGSGTPYVAYVDNADSNQVTVMKYNGGSWVAVGNTGFSAGETESTSIAIDASGTPYVAYKDIANGGKATVKKYNGSNWVTVGNAGFSPGNAWLVSMTIDGAGTTYVAYMDEVAGEKLTVMKYNGSSWVTVGNAGFSDGDPSRLSIETDNSNTPWVVYQDEAHNYKATVMKYNGSSWVNIGSAGFTATGVNYVSMKTDNSNTPYIAYSRTGGGGKAVVMKYNGSNWVYLGDSTGVSPGEATWVDIALDKQGIPYIGYSDVTINNKARVMKMAPQILAPDTPVLAATANPICNGSSTILSVQSGSLNHAANWKWYTASCGGTLVGTGDSISVSPTATTTYYTRGEGGCIISPGSCRSITITVNPIVASSVSISANPGFHVVSGTPITFTATPVNGGSTPSYQWYKNSVAVGANSASYTLTTPGNGDMIAVTMAGTCTSPAVATTSDTVAIIPVVSISGGSCANDTLSLSSSQPLTQAVWKQNGTAVQTSYATWQASATTVAGGNSSGSALNQLNTPYGLSVDGAGNIYIADNNNHRVVKWAPAATSGVVVAGGNGSGSALNQLFSPYGVCADDAGNVYVAELNNYRVTKWAPGATAGVVVAGGNSSGAALNQLSAPTGIFVDKTGNLYIADAFNNRVVKWAPGAAAGVVVAGGNSSGSALNQLSNPQNVFVDGAGNVYVADITNHRIVKWAPAAAAGVVVAGGNGSGSAPNQLNQPTGTWVDAAGNVYAVEFQGQRVVRWAPGAAAGVVIAGTGSSGNAANNFNNPLDIGLDAAGNLYITDFSNHRVQKFALNNNFKYPPAVAGNYTAEVKTFAGAAITTAGHTVNASDTVSVSIVSNAPSNTLCAGTNITFTATPVHGGTTPMYQWKKNGSNVGAPTTSATYSDNTLANGDVISCALTGNQACVISATAVSNNITMTVNPIGALSVSISANPGFHVASGTPVTFTATPVNGGVTPSYQWYKNNVAVGTNSTSYTSATPVNGDMIAVAVTGSGCTSPAVATTINTVGIIPVVSISGGSCINDTLSLGSSQPLTQAIWKQNGTAVDTSYATWQANAVTVAGGNGMGATLSQLNNAGGLFVDGAGNVYVADQGNHRIVKWAPNATAGVVAAGTGFGSANSKLNNPIDVHVDGAGNVYVLDLLNERVMKWAPGAASGVVAAGGNGTGNGLHQFNTPIGMYIDKDGNIYVADANNFRVMKWAPGAGSGTIVAGGNGSGNLLNQLNRPFGIYVDNAANVYIAERNNHRVTKWAPAATSGVVVAGGNGQGAGLNQLNNPYGVRVDAAGNIYVTEKDNHRVVRWAPGATSGVIVAGGNGLGNTANQFNDARGVFIDASGNLYVTDDDNHRVQKFALNNSFKYPPAAAGSYTAEVKTFAGAANTTAVHVVDTQSVVSVNIVSNAPSNTLCAGTSVSFTATPVHGGTAPMYQWKKNGNNVGTPTASATYSDNALVNGDVISCALTSNEGCVVSATAASNNITMTVNPVPDVNTVSNQSVCAGASTTTVNFGGTVSGTTYNWTNNTTSIGLSGSGNGNISSFATANAGTTPVTATITVTPTAAGCAGTAKTFDIAVKPVPTVNTVSNQSLCAGASTAAVSFGGNMGSSATYNWTNNTPSIGLTGSSSGDINAFAATNTGATVTTATITVTPTAAGCSGTAKTFDIAVKPIPTVNTVSNQSVCAGASTATVNFSGAVSGTTYNWTNNTTSIGLTGSSSGDINSFATVNAGTTPVTATVTVTPTAAGCPGTAKTFDIVVKPIPTVNAVSNQSLCAGASTATVNFSGAMSGTTYNWTNNPPSIGLTGSSSGDINSFATVNGGSTVTTATITVIPTAAGCPGTAKTFDIAVKPVPTVNAVSNQSVCAGASTATVNFSGAISGATYNWTNSTPSIGLTASGSNDINSFATTNTGTTVNTATITVTPTAAGCPGTAKTFDIAVKPIPTVNAVSNQSVCAGASTTTVNFSGAVSGATYNWTNNNTSIGLAGSNSGDINSFATVNAGTTVTTATITVTPTAAGCPGTAKTFDIAVKPIPTVNAVSSQILCAGASTTIVNFTGSVGSTSYNWTNNTTSIGLGANGSGNINPFTATNTGTVPVTGTVTVTPTAAGCTGTAKTFDITVKPTPDVTTVANQSVCNNANTATVNFTGGVSGTTYNWTNNTTAIGLGANGSGNINSFTATNTGTAPVTATVTVTPAATGCTGTAKNFDIVVKPIPTVNAISNQTLCNNANTTTVNFSGSVSGTVFNWVNNNTSIGLGGSNSGTINSFTATNPGSTPVTATITVIPTAAGCTGSAKTFDIVVNPTLTPSVVLTPQFTTTCQGVAVGYSAAPTNGGTAPTYQWKINGNNVATGQYYTNTGSLNNNDIVSVIMTSNAVCPSATTATAQVTMTILPLVTPTVTISANPGNAICSGTGVTFSASVTNGGTAPVYQWKKNGLNVGTNSATYNAGTTLNNFDVIICEVKSSVPCGITGASNTINMNVTPTLSPAVTVVAGPGSPACQGVAVNFNANTTNVGLTPSYQWKLNGNNVGTNSAMYSNSGTLPPGANTITCTVTNSYSCPTAPTATNTLNYTVNPTLVPTISISAAAAPNGDVCIGSSVTFNATITNGGTSPAYQWKKNGVNIATGASWNAGTSLVTGDIITCVLTSNAPCTFPGPVVTSNAVTITNWPVMPVSVSITSSTGTTGCEAKPTVFTATAVNAGSAPVYQWRKNGVDIPAATGASYTDAGLVNGDVITCRVASSIICAIPVPATSNAIAMNVLPVVPTTVQVTVTNDSIGCEGQGFVFSTYNTNGGTNPQYKWYVNGNAVPGAVQHQFSSSTLNDNDVISCEMSSSITCAFPTMSNTIGMHLDTVTIPTVEIGGYPEVTGITFYSTVKDAGANPTYQWRKNGKDVPGATAATYHTTDYEPEDKISLFVHSSAKCSNPEFVVSAPLKPAQVTAVNNVAASVSDISLYPNPNNGRFTVKGNVHTSEELLIEIINPVGQTIYRESIKPNGQTIEKQIDLGDKAAGIYMLNIKPGNDIMPVRFIMNR